MNKYKAPALAKGLAIIDLIQEHGPLSFNELQELTMDNPGSLNRYLHTLIAKDYLMKTGNTKYSLGIKLIGIAGNESLLANVSAQAKPIMKYLNETYDITVLLLAYMTDQFKAIDKYVAKDNLGMMQKNTVLNNNITTIWSNHLYASNILDTYIEEYNSNLSKEYDDYSIADVKNLIHHVQGYDYMETHFDAKKISRYGFPIRYHNQVIATLGIGTFYERLTPDALTELIHYTKNSIDSLEKSLY